MNEFLESFQNPVSFQLHGILSTVGILDIIDILIVAVIFYKIYEMLQDTRAITLVKGLIILMVLTIVCNFFFFFAFFWILQKALSFLFVALPIVFQP